MSEAPSDRLVQIAKVLKSHGTDGGILLGFRDIMPEDIDRQEPVFIAFDGLPVPFFFDSFERKGRDRDCRPAGICRPRQHSRIRRG